VLAKGLSDPRVRGLITVTRVEVPEDLKQASIHISVLPAENGELTMHGLRAAARHIRHQIADQLVMPNTPMLVFKHDVSTRQQAEVLGAIARARAELEQNDQQQEEDDRQEPDSQGVDVQDEDVQGSHEQDARGTPNSGSKSTQQDEDPEIRA
jgi:ribosome-binding factor A